MTYVKLRKSRAEIAEIAIHLLKFGTVNKVELAGRAGVSEKTAQAVLIQLMKEGRVIRPVRGTYARAG